jgi:hypothetical protein
MHPYFFLTLFLCACWIVWYYRPFDPLRLPSQKETFLNPNETYIANPAVRSMTKVPSNVQSSLPLTLRPFSPSSTTSRVCDSFIKSAFNAAWDGSKCTIPMLTYVLSRGCRFLDLEVYVFVDDQQRAPRLVVGYGGNLRENRLQLHDADVLDLPEVFKFALAHGFSATVSPTFSDPLFFHLRIHADKKHESTVTSQLTQSIQSIITPARLMRSTDLASFSLGELRNKVGIFIDKWTSPWIESTDLATIITSFSGIPSFPLLKYGSDAPAENPSITPSPSTTTNIVAVAAIPSRDPLHFMDALFSSATGSAKLGTYTLRSLPSNPSITFLAMPFYRNNRDLQELEECFNAQQTSCASSTSALAFIQEKMGEV